MRGILEIDSRALVEMAAEQEPVLRAPRVPISGLNIAVASPDTEVARSLQKAMAGRDVSKALARIESKRFADAVISPELRRRMQELRKVFASPAMKKTVMTIGSRQIKAVRKPQAEIARAAKSPAKDFDRRQGA